MSDNNPHPKTQYRITGKRVRNDDGGSEWERIPDELQDVVKHRPRSPDVAYTTVGPEDRLGIHNCEHCRIIAAITDSRRTG